MYAEAARLLREEKYQETLDKWQEIKAIDRKYPDRQSIQRIALKKLEVHRPRVTNLKQIGIISVLAITLSGIFWLAYQGLNNHDISPTLIPTNIIPAMASPLPSASPTSAPLLAKEYIWDFDNEIDGWGF